MTSDVRVRIKHRTTYHYEEPTTFGPHVIRLRPANHAQARILSYNLEVLPKPHLRWQQDGWGNRIVRATFDKVEPVHRLDVAVDAAFDIRPVNPFDFFVDDAIRNLPIRYSDRLTAELQPFLRRPELGARARIFADAHRPEGYLIDYLVAVNRDVAETVRYIIRNEPGIQSSEETLQIGSGSCRDSALLLVDILRHHGFAARFVSGYLVQLTDEGNIPDEAKGVDRDVVDLHAWAEVYIPGAGWVGLDGTSGLLAGEGHIPLAGAADPMLAGPVEGTASHAAAKLDVEMAVIRLGHEPRPRRPYTDEAWAALRSVGRNVDERLTRAGLQLTMGGEPTWTSRLHPTEPEWNGEALGPTKWAQGVRLTQALWKRLGPGGLVMHRFGKQYPGESLPRWVMQLIWRPDGEAIWHDPTRLDLGSGGHASVDDGRPVSGGRTVDDATRFRQALSAQLGLDVDRWIPGFEDPWHFLQEEQNLPSDVDPMAADLSDAEERRRLARVLNRGLGAAVGHAMPLGRGVHSWLTDTWSFRREHMFLIPGDSPMGLRLPLDRLGGQPITGWTQDPSSIAGPLPSLRSTQPTPDPHPQNPSPQDTAQQHRIQVRDLAGGPGSALRVMPWASQLRPTASVHTALCVEVRAGVVHVFLPPVPTTEDFLGLVAAVEKASKDSRVPVSVEGYPPPSDPRLKSCLVTPDPGVLEVNLPVTGNFDEYAELMATVSDAANHSGLIAEKFQLDGRVAGSGGGHHLTLGGPRTELSPFIQRPALVAALLRFVQNHPSLSYLFTGLFVGPTSQAPRIDEARHDALYELEIALQRLESVNGPPPWLTDRLLRNLLVDVSGNTHRTEISIDKLYDPGHASGRQGLLEFRAFEMPPHEQMAAAQMLLVRSVVARLASRPYQNPLIRWGSQLHDRFMLPHFLWRDFVDVLRELHDQGIMLNEDHYRPFLDFRCPLAGRHEMEGVQIEIRAALEPWPVLGEEAATTGTVRYVDSSVERVEVKVRGVDDERHVVTANGWTVPLRPTGTAAERVAGIRFKAWQPPHGLQPTISMQHPVRVDVIDTWANRSLGAVSYHVWHPEGHGYDEPPLTAFEAAARRAQRFTTEGHAPFPARPRQAEPHPEQPFTLDLRRVDPVP